MDHLFKKRLLRLLSGVMVLVMLLPVVITTIASIEWPQEIVSFERNSPVYTESVEHGTAKDKLTFPQTIRAITALPEDADMNTFVQSKPQEISADGYTSYDYYTYGYVAPKDSEALYEAGEKVIYTIYYVKKDKDGQNIEGAVETAYRIFGSIEGSENVWFACDEAGNLTGVIQNVPVSWNDNDGYNGNAPGTYKFTAAITDYSYSHPMPYATVIVNESNECTCGAADGEEHAQECPQSANEHSEEGKPRPSPGKS